MGEEDDAGSGSWSIKGFDYQVDVSVWLALDLMVASRLTSEILLEHVSEEDVEADAEEYEPGSVVDALPMREGYRLIVQAKRRSGDAWTSTSYLTLLQHGKRRKSALTRLKDDPKARYLLVTSAAVNGSARDLTVRKPGPWPRASKVPATIASKGENLGGRLAIVANQDDERLERDIKELLLERFRIPYANWKECLKSLREAAWDRMRGLSNGCWRREEVEGILLAHNGYILTASEADSFVPPTNWGDLVQALETKHALLIVGQSGSGKTRAAEALWRERQAAIPGLSRVHITHGPQQLLNDQTPPPVFYEIEDPWGRFKFEPNSMPWNAELSKVLAGAGHDRLIVATSRIDVAKSSSAFGSTKAWHMSLEAENYGLAERRTLYRNLMKELPSRLLALAHEREAEVLAQLQLPLEIRKFFDALQATEPDTSGKWPIGRVNDAIKLAHRDSIEQTVIDQIESRDAVMPAAVVWALLGAAGRISADVLRSLLDPLADREAEFEDKLASFIDSFIVGRNLRQGTDGSLTYYHPRVEAGIEAVLIKSSQRARRALRTLVEALIEKDLNDGGTWGAEQAALILEHAGALSGLKPEPDRASMDKLDTMLEARLEQADSDFEVALFALAAVGSPRSNRAEFARWLTQRPAKANPMWTGWQKSEKTPDWYERLKADPQVQGLADRFVRTLMTRGRIDYDEQFVGEIGRIAPDLEAAFVAASIHMLHGGYNGSNAAVLAGALENLDAFEVVVDEAVGIITPSAKELAERERTQLMVANEEVGDDYADVLLDTDYAQAAYDSLKGYVEALRARRGWRAILAHRHIDFLRAIWLQAIKDGEFSDADEEEIISVLEHCLGTADEVAAWRYLGLHWAPHFRETLIIRLAKGSQDRDLLQAVLKCALAHCPEQGEVVVAALVASDARIALFRLTRELAEISMDPDWFDPGSVSAIDALCRRLPEPFQSMMKAISTLAAERTPAFVEGLGDLLSGLEPATEDVREVRLRLAGFTRMNVTDDVIWTLQNSDEVDHAMLAIAVAIDMQLTDVLSEQFDHRFAAVAARAITANATSLPAPLPTALLERSAREGRLVRSAIARLIQDKPHRDHLPTLERLIRDEWTNWHAHGPDQANYAIARIAGEAILHMDEVREDTLDMLVRQARQTSDPHLMEQCLRAAVRFGDVARQRSVVGMAAGGKRLIVGQNAAFALFKEFDHLRPETVAAIGALDLLNLPAAIVDYLVVISGALGTGEALDALAARLDASPDRRVFLALLAWARNFVDPEHGTAIAARLPQGHPARLWALGQVDHVARDDLRQLGDAASVKEAFGWMGPKGVKTRV